MSLEAAIIENTAAVTKLTDVSQRLLDLRSTSLDEIKAAAAGAKAAPKTAAKKAEETSGSDVAGSASAAATESASKASADSGTNRLAEVQAVCAKYAGGTDRADERTARKEKLTWLFGKVGATKLAEIPEGKEAAVIKAVTQLIADGDLTSAEVEADTPAADDDLLAA